MWRSLVARFVRDEEVAGSNPVTPTLRSGAPCSVVNHLTGAPQHFSRRRPPGPPLRLRRKPHPTATPRLGDQRRFEVLVRSTYRDLQEARQRATMTLLERDAFPSGMEICSPGMSRVRANGWQ